MNTAKCKKSKIAVFRNFINLQIYYDIILLNI